ncbi:MAG: signal peptidase I [Leucobacter sp.]
MMRVIAERSAPEQAVARGRPLRSVVVVGWRVAVWSVLLSALALLLIAIIIPRIGGATPYTVLTGSMKPTLSPGTLIVVKPVPAKEIGIGSVITYQLESGEPTVVTHRVIGVSSANGEQIFQTQGDANDTPDDPWVREVQVRGKLWYAVPKLGYVTNAISMEQREAIKYAGAAVLIAYAAYMFTGSIRDRVRKKRERSPREGETDVASSE